jgi:hypothetical protein
LEYSPRKQQVRLDLVVAAAAEYLFSAATSPHPKPLSQGAMGFNVSYLGTG